jgi:hypothetical protein
VSGTLPRSLGRQGATFADLLVFVATVSLAGALLYPAWSARDFRARVAAAVADVDTVAAAARRALEENGAWPHAAPPGVVPDELPSLAGAETPFARTDYRLGWTSWNVVDSVEVIPEPPAPGDTPPETMATTHAPLLRSVGAITVHAADPDLLAELSDRFAGEASFVLDTMWLLVLTERASTPIAERRASGP